MRSEDGILKSYRMFLLQPDSGEILGIAGISGCGQKELLEAIAGLQPAQKPAPLRYIEDNGTKEELIGKDPQERLWIWECALSFVPEDRLGMGLVGRYGSDR